MYVHVWYEYKIVMLIVDCDVVCKNSNPVATYEVQYSFKYAKIS